MGFLQPPKHFSNSSATVKHNASRYGFAITCNRRTYFVKDIVSLVTRNLCNYVIREASHDMKVHYVITAISFYSSHYLITCFKLIFLEY